MSYRFAQGLFSCFYVDVVTIFFVYFKSSQRRWEEVTRLEGANRNKYLFLFEQ